MTKIVKGKIIRGRMMESGGQLDSGDGEKGRRKE